MLYLQLCFMCLGTESQATCSQLIGTEHFPCPTCTTALVIHQWKAKLALENVLIIWVS